MTSFLVIPYFWGSMYSSNPLMILFKVVTNLIMALLLTVQNSGTYIAVVSLSFSPGYGLIPTFNQSNLFVEVIQIVFWGF